MHRSLAPATSPSRRSGLLTTLPAAVLAAFLVACALPRSTDADAVYVNGKVVTVDRTFSIAQAVAVKDGRFIGVGTTEGIRKFVAPRTRVVDLGGCTVIPGLMDSHSHMIGAGRAETTAQVIRAKTVAEAQAIITEFIKAKNVPAGQWVETSRWHPPSQLHQRERLAKAMAHFVSNRCHTPCWSHSRRFEAQRWMAVGPSQPHTMPQTAITTMSTRRCFRFRVCRGSERDSK